MKHYPHLAARLFNTPLLIHPQKLDAIIAGLGGRLLGAPASEFAAVGRLDADAIAPELFSTRKGERAASGAWYRIVDGVAVVPVNGALVHRSRMDADSTFLVGYNDLAASVEDAMSNSDVHAVLTVYDSPGGEVQGAFEYAQRMLDMRGRKPMKAIADGMAASAAYLGASAADEFVIGRTGYAGSIGVVMRHVDFSRALQNDGIQVTHIFAGAHKVDGNPFAPLPDAVRADLQAEINSLYDMFVEAVVAHRAGLTADAVRRTEAATLRGEAAIAAGLADRVGTTDQLIAELAAQRTARSYGLPARATADRGETHMSGTTAPAGEQQAGSLTQVDIDRARAEGHAAGHAEGIKAGRALAADIIGHAEATGRQPLATRLARMDGMTIETAAELLAAAPKDTPAAQGSAFAAAMGALGNPGVKPDREAGAEDDASATAANIVALFQGRK